MEKRLSLQYQIKHFLKTHFLNQNLFYQATNNVKLVYVEKWIGAKTEPCGTAAVAWEGCQNGFLVRIFNLLTGINLVEIWNVKFDGKLAFVTW